MREHVLYTHKVLSFEMTVCNMEPLKGCCSQRLLGRSLIPRVWCLENACECL